MPRAAVLGAGSWGTTFAAVLADAGQQVRLLARDPELAAEVERTRENRRYLPGVCLPPAVQATADRARALDGAEVVVLAVPAQTLRGNLEAWTSLLPDVPLVSLMKGVETGSGLRMSQVVCEVVGAPAGRVAVVSGPNLAAEIARHHPGATVVACADDGLAHRVAAMVATRYLRPYTSTDVVGCELAGAAKNVIALAAGMAEGRGFGETTKASLITRGLVEITRLGVAYGAQAQTFAGLAGMGDLVATCSSPLSRNHTVGRRVGAGEPLREVVADMRMVAEGVASSRSVLELARAAQVDMPIAEHVVGVLFEDLPVDRMVTGLMDRDIKGEFAPPAPAR